MYARLARTLPRYLRARDTLDVGRRRLAECFGNRERNFLELAERSIYGHPGSPYLPLLRRAGCELEDLRRLVTQDGLEVALRRLRAEGVYVRFEESKGREPITRGSLAYAVDVADFDNPRAHRHLVGFSSGSTGARSRYPVDLDYMAFQSPIHLLVEKAQGIHDLPRATIRGTLPESSGFGGNLRGARHGRTPERWFAPVLEPPREPELRFRIAHAYVMGMMRLCGFEPARPEPVRMDEVAKIAHWAADAVARAGGSVVDCTPSMALRIALAARDEGIDLAGTVFRTAGEAMTAAKKEAIAAAGARVVADYLMTGLYGAGYGCVNPAEANDQHLLTHHIAVIQGRRSVGAVEVDAFLFTSLLPFAPRVSLNLESDDYGVLEERRCGCPVEELGFSTHVRGVRSFKKLTAEGVTLVGTDMEHVLESVLPARFGGTALDYQLAEEEDERGFTRLCINVHPRVELRDEAAVIDTVLAGLAKASISADLAGRLWNQAGAIRVRRVAPVLGGRGKLLPLHLLRRDGASERIAEVAGVER